jgi:MFS family permease
MYTYVSASLQTGETRMGAWGGIIMGLSGAVFAAATLALEFGWRGISICVPFLAFAAIMLAAILTMRLPGQPPARPRHARRVILWSTIGEGAGIVVAPTILINVGHPELLLPVTALVVGLHFLPMARRIPFPGFYWIGFALLAAAATGFALSQTIGGKISGLASAAVLWTAAVIAVGRERKAKHV